MPWAFSHLPFGSSGPRSLQGGRRCSVQPLRLSCCMRSLHPSGRLGSIPGRGRPRGGGGAGAALSCPAAFEVLPAPVSGCGPSQQGPTSLAFRNSSLPDLQHRMNGTVRLPPVPQPPRGPGSSVSQIPMSLQGVSGFASGFLGWGSWPGSRLSVSSRLTSVSAVPGS
uniref:Uncharacterized protein n=1 Tax=Sphaerodactylus townsendi TaxID=933632 RepID=A0ACB8G887_9SAUR